MVVKLSKGGGGIAITNQFPQPGIIQAHLVLGVEDVSCMFNGIRSVRCQRELSKRISSLDRRQPRC